MKKKTLRESFAVIDRRAHAIDDIRPLSPAMRSQWEAAKRTGPNPAAVGREKNLVKNRSSCLFRSSRRC